MRLRSAGTDLRAGLPRRLREPWSVLALLLLLQWGALVAFVETVRHNRWLFFQGGDQTFFYTSAWVLAHGHVPYSWVGYAWSLVLAPLTWIFGPNVLAALPAIVLIQTLVLLPISTLGMYGIGTRLGGRIVGYLAAFLWVVGPYAAIPLWDHRYHAKYVEQFLPQALGLTGLGDFPSMVFLIVAAYFVVRSLDTGAWTDAALAGILSGFAIGIKPANVLFLPGAALGFAVARRVREPLAYAVALAPAVVALALWKYKGLGYIPIVTHEPTIHGDGAPLALAAAGGFPLALVFSKYLHHVNWAQLQQNYLQLREFFWSVRLVQWIPFAGFLALARQSWAKTFFLAGWFGTFLLVKGSSPVARVENGSFWRLFLPGLPPFVLFAAALPLLWPRRGILLAQRFRPTRTHIASWRRPGFLAPVALLAVLPLAVVALTGSSQSRNVATDYPDHVFLPVDSSFNVTALAGSGAVTLMWPHPAAESAAFFRVYRAHRIQLGQDPQLPPGHDGIRCTPKYVRPGTGGAKECWLEMTPLAATRGREYVDHPPPGRWTYRVGLTANWLNDPTLGDVLLLSTPARVTVH